MEKWQAKPQFVMKTLALLIALCLPALANEDGKNAPRNLHTAYEQAIANRDLNALKPHLADNFTAVMITAEAQKR